MKAQLVDDARLSARHLRAYADQLKVGPGHVAYHAAASLEGLVEQYEIALEASRQYRNEKAELQEQLEAEHASMEWWRDRANTLEEQLESVKRDGLRLRERLNQAEAFIDHLDANYRYEEWLGEEHEDDSNPAKEPDA